jgi:hypothetical protein
MAGRKGSLTGRCQGCNHPERVRIERFLATGAAIKGAARKFAIDYHALRRHWRNHVSAEARATYIAGPAAATRLQRRVALHRRLGGFLLRRLAAAPAVVFEDLLARHRLDQEIGQRPDQSVDSIR